MFIKQFVRGLMEDLSHFKQWGNTNAYREPMKHYIERCKEFPKRGNGLIMVEKRAETFYTRKTKDNQNAE